ncbi:MAG: cation transporter [Actinomycetota bacterium]|nr:cation transporter [Actinomycetota bacterium]
MTEQQVMKVNGMTCDGCERRITSAVSEVDGVDGVSADHAGVVTLQGDPAITSSDAVRSVIEDLGYEVVSA